MDKIDSCALGDIKKLGFPGNDRQDEPCRQEAAESETRQRKEDHEGSGRQHL